MDDPPLLEGEGPALRQADVHSPSSVIAWRETFRLNVSILFVFLLLVNSTWKIKKQKTGTLHYKANHTIKSVSGIPVIRFWRKMNFVRLG